MTTIAYRSGIMAGDRQVDLGYCKGKLPTKVFDRDNLLIGLAGAWISIDDFLAWMHEYKTAAIVDRNVILPKPYHLKADGSSDAMAMVVECYNTDRPRIYLVQCEAHFMEIVPHSFEESGPFFAIGSGAQFALGAMARGATAKGAIQIASLFDDNTGKGITEVGMRFSEESWD